MNLSKYIAIDIRNKIVLQGRIILTLNSIQNNPLEFYNQHELQIEVVSEISANQLI